MNALTTDEAERLSKLLGMLGSNFAGERDAAGLAAVRFLHQRGLQWTDLIGAPARQRSHAAPWRDTVQRCRAQPGKLRPWERGFLDNLAGFPRVSAKQQTILHEIAERLGVRATP